MSDQIKNTIQEVFDELATALETGDMGPKIKIALTINGSEHGFDVMKEAAKTAQDKGLFEVILIGEELDWTKDFEHYEATTEQEVEDKIDELYKNNTIQGVVTLHHTFPIGVSTVGRVVTPATGKEIYIATTTGTTSTVRTEAMVLNAINGIIAAKASGVENPSVGILNVEGANIVERSLKTLKDNGYEINFGDSVRSDGGAVLRGNDLLVGSTDVVVTDSLTGNLLMKMLSAYSTGGTYEVSGFGYGPGIGEDYHQNICIISRASGVPVIVNALQYAYELAKGQLNKISEHEYNKANSAKLSTVREDLQPKASAAVEEVTAPEKEVVTEQINGIDVLDLDDAVQNLWREGIYAESGMGCSGPIVLVNEDNIGKAEELIKETGLV